MALNAARGESPSWTGVARRIPAERKARSTNAENGKDLRHLNLQKLRPGKCSRPMLDLPLRLQ